MDIRIFNKTKSLGRNQALNKNLSNGKKQKTLSIEFRTKKKKKKKVERYYLAIDWHKMPNTVLDKSTPYIQYTIKFFRKAWFLQVSSKKILIYLPCYYL